MATDDTIDELAAENARLKAALLSAKAIAFEAWGEWDSDNDSRVGKLLKALAGHLRGYRADIDAIHDAMGD
jgi:hypothetical protein